MEYRKIWDKVLKNGPTKTCERQLIKFFEMVWCLKQISTYKKNDHYIRFADIASPVIWLGKGVKDKWQINVLTHFSLTHFYTP